jgi:hypothetical protein
MTASEGWGLGSRENMMNDPSELAADSFLGTDVILNSKT